MEPWSIFVESGIPVSVILLTLGELGIPKKDIGKITPGEMKEIRRKEFIQAMQHWGASFHILNYSDLSLSEQPLQNPSHDVLKIVREQRFGVLFSFHPYEITPMFDHPDHNSSGAITKIVASAADVDYYHPELPALDYRPSLYFWTTDHTKATHSVALTKETRNRRKNYLFDYYPSQFSENLIDQWSPIFDQISHQPDGSHQELYQKVR